MSEASPGSPERPSADRPQGPALPAPDAAAGDGLEWMGEDYEEIGERPSAPPAGRIVAGVLSGLLVLALLAWALPWATGSTWPQILSALGALPVWAVPAMLVLGVAALLLESLTVRAAVPGARTSTALLGHAASQGAALAVPGGSMLGLGLLAWILRRAGLALPVILTGIIAASLVEMAITSVLIPLLGLGAYALSSLLAPTGLELPGALWAAVVAVAVAVLALVLTAVLLQRRVLAGLLSGLGGAVPENVACGILHQRDVLVEMLRRRGPALVLPTLAARVLQWGALLAAIEAVGADVPLLLTVAIFALGRVLALVPLTPGGAGIAETVGGAALVALGVASADAAAAMLLLLVAMLIVPLAAGGLALALAVGGRPRHEAEAR